MNRNTHLDSFEVFPWNENLATNIAIIDEQHRKLLGLLNTLAGALVQNDAVELTRIFDELAEYAKHHFETEEAIWASCFGDDDWLRKHEKTHAAFLPEVAKLKERQEGESLRSTIEQVVKFLIRWLAFHIIDSDKRMAIVMRELQAGASLPAAKETSDKLMSGVARLLVDAVLEMYDRLSSRTLALLRERAERIKAEEGLREANCKLEELAITDQLTGLFNRRHFDNVIEKELKRGRRGARFLAFILLDLDHFKRLNDHYGHVQGDVALRKVGEALKRLCRRPADFPFRLGGEEFGVLIADHSTESRIEFAEILRAGIADLRIPNVKSDVADHLTVSVGAVAKVPTAADTQDSFMKTADARLYRAKEQGRNRVIASD